MLFLGRPDGALGQDVFGLFGTGAEAKVHAGGGQLASREAPANYYNPANLIEARGLATPYVELDILSLNYAFTYEGYAPVLVSKVTPLPFFGATVSPLPALTIATSFLPGDYELTILTVIAGGTYRL